MGFGTLFIGYFFLVNISYFAYTDIIAALVMLMGLYRLSGVNIYFKSAMLSALAFTAVALVGISLAVTEMFTFGEWLPLTVSYVNAVRYAVICALTYFIIRGIRDVSLEVGADTLYSSTKKQLPFSALFMIAALLEIPFVGTVLGNAAPYVYLFLLLATVIFTFAVLVLIYKSYMQICMPEDAVVKDKKSRFEFLNRFYDRIESGSRNYAEYKMKANKEKQNKRKK